MAPSANVSNNNARHTWSYQDRVILLLLSRMYDNPKTSLAQIWRSINRFILLQEGFAGGEMPIQVLYRQTANLKHVNAPVWKDVMEPPTSHIRDTFWREKNMIENAAEKLGIQLILKVVQPTSTTVLNETQAPRVTDRPIQRADWSPSPAPVTERDFAVRPLDRATIRSFEFNELPTVASTTSDVPIETQGASSSASTPPDNSDSRLIDSSNHPPVVDDAVDKPEEAFNNNKSDISTNQPAQPSHTFEGVVVPSVPRTPARQNLEDDPLANVRLSPKLMTVFNSDGRQGRRHPVLLFRAFDPMHGFTARKFLKGRYAPSPGVTSAAFKDAVTPHLNVDTDYESPFISLTQFPKYALRIISASSTPKNFAVFLYNDLDDEGRMKGKIRPRLVPRIVDDHGLHHLPGKYRGRGEFLMHGRIDTDPLLVLHTRTALELYGELLNMQECSPEAGYDLYPYFADVDAEHRETLVRALVSGFKINGYDWGYHSPRWEEFADMLFEPDEGDYRAPRGRSVLSQVTVESGYLRIGEAYVAVEEPQTPESSEADDEQVPGEDNPFNARDVKPNNFTETMESPTAGEEPQNGSSTQCAVAMTPSPTGAGSESSAVDDTDNAENLVEIINNAASTSRSSSIISSDFPSVPVPAGFSSPVMVDLTIEDDDEETEVLRPAEPGRTASTHATVPVDSAIATTEGEANDIEMLENEEDEDGFVFLAEHRRVMSVRSRSVATPALQTTPTPVDDDNFIF